MEILAFMSGKGGVGKTTLAANVAVALTQRKQRVLLIDLDPQNAQRFHLGMDPEEVAGLAREGVGPASIFDSPFEVSFIPFGRLREDELEEFESHLRLYPDWLAQGLESLGQDSFDYILLDTPPGPTVFLQQALAVATRALMVVLADAASFATIPKAMRLVSEYTAGNPNFRAVHVLLNQLPMRGKLGHQVQSELLAQYPGQIIPTAVHRDFRVAQALAFERPVLQYEPGCKASLDLQYIADWLLNFTKA